MAALRLNALVYTCWQKIVWFWKLITGRLAKEQKEREQKEFTEAFTKAVTLPDVVEIILGRDQKRIPALVVKNNPRTVWVRLPNDDEIKRHRIKQLIQNGFVSQAKIKGQLTYEEIIKYCAGGKV